jgi:hypothetical protein
VKKLNPGLDEYEGQVLTTWPGLSVHLVFDFINIDLKLQMESVLVVVRIISV